MGRHELGRCHDGLAPEADQYMPPGRALHLWCICMSLCMPEVEDAGIEIIPTFRTPHVTLAHTDRAELIRRLLGCKATQIDNPYYEI